MKQLTPKKYEIFFNDFIRIGVELKEAQKAIKELKAWENIDMMIWKRKRKVL